MKVKVTETKDHDGLLARVMRMQEAEALEAKDQLHRKPVHPAYTSDAKECCMNIMAPFPHGFIHSCGDG